MDLSTPIYSGRLLTTPFMHELVYIIHINALVENPNHQVWSRSCEVFNASILHFVRFRVGHVEREGAEAWSTKVVVFVRLICLSGYSKGLVWEAVVDYGGGNTNNGNAVQLWSCQPDNDGLRCYMDCLRCIHRKVDYHEDAVLYAQMKIWTCQNEKILSNNRSLHLI